MNEAAARQALVDRLQEFRHFPLGHARLAYP